MKILLTGASGFIGSHLRRVLLDAGHTLLCTSRVYRRDTPGCRWVVVDFAHVSTARWSELLVGVDAVVNTVGVWRERGEATFARVHGTGPRRLFAACVHAGVQRVVHLSALGADAHAAGDCHLSKRAADEHLLSLPLDATVVQPALVFGLDGRGARVLLTWACLPLVPLPAGGRQMLQPVHVDDVADAVAALLHARERWRGQRIALVGPVPLPLPDVLRALRAALGVPGWHVWAVPPAVLSIVLRVAGWWPRVRFDRVVRQMLERGNCGDASAIATLLGRVPRAASRFIEPAQAAAARREAQRGWWLPLLRASLAALSIGTTLAVIWLIVARPA